MNKQALTGVNVLDFGQALAGPMAMKHLADHGACVVRVESAVRGQRGLHNVTSLSFAARTSTSKYGMALNLKHPRAREVVERLIHWADVVNENFVPGKMKNLGLDYKNLCKIKPDIIMASCSIFGQTGSSSRQPGLDGTATAMSGRMYLTGWPDRGGLTSSSVPYGDAVHPLFIASAIIAALDYRRRTGKGQHIDAAMLEVCAQQIAPSFLECQSNEHMPKRAGNRIPNASPHGVFPCAGHDRWCAITVFTEDEWTAFCHVIGDPEWTKQPEYATLQSRKKNEDKLEKLVSEWTQGHSAYEIMHLMQEAGVPAGVVQNAADTVDHDPQLKEDEVLKPLKHQDVGIFGHPTPPYRLSKTVAQVRTFPTFGEHTEYVCTHFLGMSDSEYKELSEAEVFK
ncbi:CaiB/BaiF CoA transferase family protein [Thermodesulfobacteriota bacterium]